MKKPKTVKRGRVQKIIESAHPVQPDKAEIGVEGADHLYREIRIENSLRDESGEERALKKDAEVDVVIEADREATVPKKSRGKI